MKSIKLKENQVKFIVNMIGLMIFVISYLYVCAYFDDKTEKLYQETKLTNAQIETIKKNIAQQDSVSQSTDEINAQIQAIVDRYPVDIKKVDNIMFVDHMEEELKIIFSTVQPTDSTPFFDTIVPVRSSDSTGAEQSAPSNEEAVAPTASPTQAPQSENASETDSKSSALVEVDGLLEEGTPAAAPPAQTDTTATVATMTGLQSTITMNFQASYVDFKKFLQYIAEYPQKTVIDSASVSVDKTTNQLTGTIVLRRFALSGTGKVYENPRIDDISIGTDNIFGTD